MGSGDERAEKVRVDAVWEEFQGGNDRAIDTGALEQIARAARDAGLRIDVSKIRDAAQAERVLRTLELVRSRMR